MLNSVYQCGWMLLVVGLNFFLIMKMLGRIVVHRHSRILLRVTFGAIFILLCLSVAFNLILVMRFRCGESNEKARSKEAI